jgi:GT2 family glycosyltransferase
MSHLPQEPDSAGREGPGCTIVICVYNRGEEVQTCLRSLLDLAASDYEIVLVDDCSTDDTPERLLEFQRTHTYVPVTIVRNAINRGVSGSRNAGTEAARGAIVAFTDSDCRVDRDWLTALTAPFDDERIAATGGTVRNPPPGNLAERAYVGRSRIKQSRMQNRALVGCNMAFRKSVLSETPFDESLSYYCDEDDIARRLTALGRGIAFAAGAVVHHHHRLTTRSYLRMAYRQGIGAARLWYKHGAYLGRDLIFSVLALVTVPLAVIDPRLATIPACFGVLQVAAVAYNESALKGKSLTETLVVFPIALLYYVFKTAGYLRTVGAIALGRERPIRASRRSWRQTLAFVRRVRSANDES